MFAISLMRHPYHSDQELYIYDVYKNLCYDDENNTFSAVMKNDDGDVDDGDFQKYDCNEAICIAQASIRLIKLLYQYYQFFYHATLWC